MSNMDELLINAGFEERQPATLPWDQEADEKQQIPISDREANKAVAAPESINKEGTSALDRYNENEVVSVTKYEPSFVVNGKTEEKESKHWTYKDNICDKFKDTCHNLKESSRYCQQRYDATGGFNNRKVDVNGHNTCIAAYGFLSSELEEHRKPTNTRENPKTSSDMRRLYGIHTILTQNVKGYTIGARPYFGEKGRQILGISKSVSEDMSQIAQNTTKKSPRSSVKVSRKIIQESKLGYTVPFTSEIVKLKVNETTKSVGVISGKEYAEERKIANVKKTDKTESTNKEVKKEFPRKNYESKSNKGILKNANGNKANDMTERPDIDNELDDLLRVTAEVMDSTETGDKIKNGYTKGNVHPRNGNYGVRKDLKRDDEIDLGLNGEKLHETKFDENIHQVGKRDASVGTSDSMARNVTEKSFKKTKRKTKLIKPDENIYNTLHGYKLKKEQNVKNAQSGDTFDARNEDISKEKCRKQVMVVDSYETKVSYSEDRTKNKQNKTIVRVQTPYIGREMKYFPSDDFIYPGERNRRLDKLDEEEDDHICKGVRKHKHKKERTEAVNTSVRSNGYDREEWGVTSKDQNEQKKSKVERRVKGEDMLGAQGEVFGKRRCKKKVRIVDERDKEVNYQSNEDPIKDKRKKGKIIFRVKTPFKASESVYSPRNECEKPIIEKGKQHQRYDKPYTDTYGTSFNDCDKKKKNENNTVVFNANPESVQRKIRKKKIKRDKSKHEGRGNKVDREKETSSMKKQFSTDNNDDIFDISPAQNRETLSDSDSDGVNLPNTNKENSKIQNVDSCKKLTYKIKPSKSYSILKHDRNLQNVYEERIVRPQSILERNAHIGKKKRRNLRNQKRGIDITHELRQDNLNEFGEEFTGEFNETALIGENVLKADYKTKIKQGVKEIVYKSENKTLMCANDDNEIKEKGDKCKDRLKENKDIIPDIELGDLMYDSDIDTYRDSDYSSGEDFFSRSPTVDSRDLEFPKPSSNRTFIMCNDETNTAHTNMVKGLALTTYKRDKNENEEGSHIPRNEEESYGDIDETNDKKPSRFQRFINWLSCCIKPKTDS